MRCGPQGADHRNGLADAERDIEDGTVEEDLNKTVSEMFLDNHKKWIDLFLFAWATAGWAVFTFAGNGLFSTTGNGKCSLKQQVHYLLCRSQRWAMTCWST